MQRREIASPPERRLTTVLAWSAGIAAAILLGVYARSPQLAEQAHTGPLYPRVPPPSPDPAVLLDQLGVGSVTWYAAVLAAPFLFLGARRLDAERHRRLASVAIALVTVAVLAAGTAILEYFIVYRGAPERPGAASYLPVALRHNLLPWIALAGIVAAVEGRRRSRRAALEHERLRAEVAEQRLIALTGQLQPHFLFNTLQGISTLIHRDADAADVMLAKLADLLRDLLRHRDRVLVPLEDEVRCARTYLEIAHLRFADRLAFEIDVPSELGRLEVPLFILQPLIENALAHGIGARIRGGRIVLRASRSNARLTLEVEDDGEGIAAGSSRREGVGLDNTRERLSATFGMDHTFELEPRNGGGTLARIVIPARSCALSPEPS